MPVIGGESQTWLHSRYTGSYVSTPTQLLSVLVITGSGPVIVYITSSGPPGMSCKASRLTRFFSAEVKPKMLSTSRGEAGGAPVGVGLGVGVPWGVVVSDAATVAVAVGAPAEAVAAGTGDASVVACVVGVATVAWANFCWVHPAAKGASRISKHNTEGAPGIGCLRLADASFLFMSINRGKYAPI